jgi:predicted GNAT family N-acyltransferase
MRVSGESLLGRRAPGPTQPARITLRVGSWDQLGEAARAVRLAVFVQEQGIPASLDFDVRDATATHAVAFDEAGRPVATGRLLPDAHVGRMAVLSSERGKGLGASILRSLVAVGDGRGLAALRLHAQTSAIGFYQREGFVTEGGIYEEAGIPHQTMVRILGTRG